LSDPIALDTSLVVEALLATQPLHGVCDAFLTPIFDSGVSVVTSELLRAELAETAFAIAMKERWAGKWRAHRTDGRTQPRAGRLLNNTLARYDEMLGSLPHISVRLGQVADSAPQIMTKYGLTSYDAIHPLSPLPPLGWWCGDRACRRCAGRARRTAARCLCADRSFVDSAGRAARDQGLEPRRDRTGEPA
jgi:predicted nucleic acid-binding protein